MADLTQEGLRLVGDVANRNGFSVDAALALLNSLRQGNGYQAQFNHPELGGMGQWSQGGMIMIGDMFNNDLKYRVGALCNELGNLVRSQPLFQPQSQDGGNAGPFVSGGGSSWWPSDLGSPSSTGGQNDMRYAYFPNARRLAIQLAGQVRVYDTGEHSVWGFSQQQGGDQSLTFDSQFGAVRVADLPLISPQADPQTPAPSPHAQPAPRAPEAARDVGTPDVFAMIERLSDLRQKNVLSDEEFAAKKAELLSRL